MRCTNPNCACYAFAYLDNDPSIFVASVNFEHDVCTDADYANNLPENKERYLHPIVKKDATIGTSDLVRVINHHTGSHPTYHEVNRVRLKSR